MTIISIEELEAAIRRCCVAQPAVNYRFSPEVRLLSGIWGDMVYRRKRTLDLGLQAPISRVVLERWLATSAEQQASDDVADDAAEDAADDAAEDAVADQAEHDAATSGSASGMEQAPSTVAEAGRLPCAD